MIGSCGIESRTVWRRLSALPLTLTCSVVCPPGEGANTANTEVHPVLSSCSGSAEVTVTWGRLHRAGAAEPESWGQGASDVCKTGGTLQVVGRHLVQTWRIQARVPCCAWSSKNMRIERAGAGGGTPRKQHLFNSSTRAVCWGDSWLSSKDEGTLTCPWTLKFSGEVMPKTQSLCTSAESNLRDRVLGEVEKQSFIAFSGKGGQSRPLLWKTVSPPGRIWRVL